MKRVFFLLVLLSLAGLARADDQTQAVQQALKDQGFYYGDVDGQEGAETDAAIRRYQIRQGLEVTGKLDAQTLSALNLGSKSPNTLEAAPPQPQAQPQPTEPPNGVVQSDHDFLKQEPAATPEPAPVDEGAVPPAAQPVEPQEPQQPQEPPQQAYEGQSLPADYARFFRKTPYETAPPVVQRSTVQRAQTRLGREGFYRGIADGELGDTFKRALVAYQRDAELAPSGRLDLDTLAAMDLLPRRQVVIRPPLPPVPFFYGGPVYRGVWVH